MKTFIEKVKSTVRGIMFEVAKLLDMLTNSFIRPNHITYLALLGHVVVLLALTEGRFTQAAILLAGFGLMDSLDGALARYQKRESDTGMLLDSSTDRAKEALVYAGFAYYFAAQTDQIGALVAVLALGASFLVSYIKAKGEAALAESNQAHEKELNREFEFGIFSYEIRMTTLVIGLAVGEPRIAVTIVAIGATITAVERFIRISKRLT